MSAPRSATRQQVQRFYDDTGWKKCGQGLYADAVLFEDLREVSGDYIRNCHLRVNRCLPGPGDFLLDVASGPVQYAEYLTYGDRFGRRRCVDLPFKSGCVAAVVSLHTLDHVPAAEQAQAWRELYRVFDWRSLSVGFLMGDIHAALGGKRLLAAVYRLEERYPGLLGRLGQYPLFVVDQP